jgi:HSP20 family protein
MSLPTRVNRNLAVDPFEAVQRDFESLLGRVINGRGDGAGTRLAPYGVDVREDADHLYVEAELPGFKKDEVDITLENQTLTISGERRETPAAENKGEWLLNERRYTRFLRSFTLPPTVSEQSVNAKLENGVLTITLNKREETKPRKITVS